MILTIAAISAAITLLVEGAKYAVKKTKTTTDDKVVAFIDDHLDDILRYISTKVPTAPKAPGTVAAPRERDRDHRGN